MVNQTVHIVYKLRGTYLCKDNTGQLFMLKHKLLMFRNIYYILLCIDNTDHLKDTLLHHTPKKLATLNREGVKCNELYFYRGQCVFYSFVLFFSDG